VITTIRQASGAHTRDPLACRCWRVVWSVARVTPKLSGTVRCNNPSAPPVPGGCSWGVIACLIRQYSSSPEILPTANANKTRKLKVL
jgi:hypothetical protein